ncbi:MAG: biotin--[acetyl-CoA-carboxylase] ligase [Ruminococcus sp.]|nr:biotin--[acetyl-CoA-carboxylase] ligase [Ruminococcus sp.]
MDAKNKSVKAPALSGGTFVSETVPADNNSLSAEIISASMKSVPSDGQIIVLDEVDSTNTFAKKLASEGAPHGTAVIADMQTGGKGRLGRKFVSPSGKGIYLSVVIRPTFELALAPMITSAAAVAVAKAVEKLTGTDLQIKWVNDLYMNGRKICGILTEASIGFEIKHLDYAVIGIGINVRSVRDDFDDELKSIATSIEDETGKRIDRNTLCGAVLDSLEEVLSTMENRSFLDDYRRRELLTGNMITANIGGVTRTGKALGIDNNANLIVQFPNGTVKNLSSGEANLCRIAKNKALENFQG